MANNLTDPETGLPVEEVTPGSANDPFTANPGGTSAEPSPPQPGTDAKPQEPAQGSSGEGAGTPAKPATGEPAPQQQGKPPGEPQKPEEEPPPPSETPVAKPEEEFESEEELQAAVQRLNDFVEEQKAQEREELRREFQSSTDQRITRIQEEAREREKQLRNELRELQTHGLSDEEKAKLQATWEQDDRKGDLDEYAKKLDDMHVALNVATLLKDYAEYGVEEKDLEELKSVEEMQLFCAEVKASYFEELAKRGPQKPSAGEETRPEQKGAEKPPAAAPAGASAPSDVGGGGAAPPPKEPRTDASPEALEENLRAMGWETVQVPQKQQ